MAETAKENKTEFGRRRTGVVTSTGGDKTIRVAVNTLVTHRRYGKHMRRRTKLAVHDPNNAADAGDTVEIAECRPISKTKSWRLIRIVSKAAIVPEISTD